MTISELWLEFYQMPFPKGYGGQDVNGVCVTLLDSDAAGCISSFLTGQQEHLSVEKQLILKDCETRLEEVLPFLDDEAFEYFVRLHTLCCMVLDCKN